MNEQMDKYVTYRDITNLRKIQTEYKSQNVSTLKVASSNKPNRSTYQHM